MRRLNILAILCFAAAGCASDRWVRTGPDFEPAGDLELSLQHRIEDGAVLPQGFAHPVDVSPRELALLMSGLRYARSGMLGGSEAEPVFDAEEVAALAPALSQALAAAGPDERVYFASPNWGGSLIFSHRRITRGVVFAAPTRVLNVAFIEVNEDVDPMDYAQADRNRRWREPTGITSYSQPLVALPWYALKEREDGGGPHPLWCVIDLADVAARVDAEKAGPAAEGPGPGPAVSAPESSGGVKEKLKVLKEMLEEGLITQDDYDAKKKDLLESL